MYRNLVYAYSLIGPSNFTSKNLVINKQVHKDICMYRNAYLSQHWFIQKYGEPTARGQKKGKEKTKFIDEKIASNITGALEIKISEYFL